MTTTACVWCGRPVSPQRGGSPRRFCTSLHKAAFHRAARKWAERAIEVGVLTVADIKSDDPGAYTLHRISPAPIGRSEPYLRCTPSAALPNR
jgi:hypothetical protein